MSNGQLKGCSAPDALYKVILKRFLAGNLRGLTDEDFMLRKLISEHSRVCESCHDAICKAMRTQEVAETLQQCADDRPSSVAFLIRYLKLMQTGSVQ